MLTEALKSFYTPIYLMQADPVEVWLLLPGGLVMGTLAARSVFVNHFKIHEEHDQSLGGRISQLLSADGDEPPPCLLMEDLKIFSNGQILYSAWAAIAFVSVQAWGTDLKGPLGGVATALGGAVWERN